MYFVHAEYLFWISTEFPRLKITLPQLLFVDDPVDRKLESPRVQAWVKPQRQCRQSATTSGLRIFLALFLYIAEGSQGKCDRQFNAANGRAFPFCHFPICSCHFCPFLPLFSSSLSSLLSSFLFLSKSLGRKCFGEGAVASRLK